MISGLLNSLKKTFSGKEEEEDQIITQKVKTVTGKAIQKHYLKKKLIGCGAFAECYITENLQTKKLYATKVIAKQNRNRSKLLNQLVIHQMLHHPYIVDFSHAFEDKYDIYVFMELCPNNSLEHLVLKKGLLAKKEIQRILYQLIQALIYVHSKNVIHRDIKPRNIFLGANNEVKLGDFGLAIKLEFEGERKRSICGTPQYMAPQMIDGCGYGKQVDVWSVGILMYELFAGKTPFFDGTNEKIMEKVCDVNFEFTQKAIPKDALSLIKRMLIKNPQLRPSFKQILSHSFFDEVHLKDINSVKLQKLSCFNLNFESPRMSITNRDSCKIDNQSEVPTGRTRLVSPDFKYNLDSESPKNQTDRQLDKLIVQERLKTINFQTLGEKMFDETKMVYFVDEAIQIGDNHVAYTMNDNSCGLLKKDEQVLHQNLTQNTIKLEKKGKNNRISTIIDDINSQMRTLLNKAKKNMFKNINAGRITLQMTKSCSSVVYMTKFTKHKQICFLKLSNNIVQLKFADNTSALIDAERPHETMFYVDNQSKVSELSVEELLQGTQDLVSIDQIKMNYIKKFLFTLGVDKQKNVSKREPSPKVTQDRENPQSESLTAKQQSQLEQKEDNLKTAHKFLTLVNSPSVPRLKASQNIPAASKPPNNASVSSLISNNNSNSYKISKSKSPIGNNNYINKNENGGRIQMRSPVKKFVIRK